MQSLPGQYTRGSGADYDPFWTHLAVFVVVVAEWDREMPCKFVETSVCSLLNVSSQWKYSRSMRTSEFCFLNIYSYLVSVKLTPTLTLAHFDTVKCLWVKSRRQFRQPFTSHLYPWPERKSDNLWDCIVAVLLRLCFRPVLNGSGQREWDEVAWFSHPMLSKSRIECLPYNQGLLLSNHWCD